MTTINVSEKLGADYPAVTVEIFGLQAIPEYRRLRVHEHMTQDEIDQLQPLDPSKLTTEKSTVEFRRGENKTQQRTKIKTEVQKVVDARNGIDPHAGNIKAELGQYEV